MVLTAVRESRTLLRFDAGAPSLTVMNAFLSSLFEKMPPDAFLVFEDRRSQLLSGIRLQRLARELELTQRFLTDLELQRSNPSCLAQLQSGV